MLFQRIGDGSLAGRWTCWIAGTALLACATTAGGQDHWPQFRGPDSTGVAHNEGLPDRWSATENVAWKTDIPGRGWSSPIVWGNRVFLTTAVNSGTAEEPKKGLYFGGNRPDPPDAVHQWKVYCLDLLTGEILWQHQVHEGKPETPIHVKNSYASETPVTDGQRVYFCFGSIGLFCFDMQGNQLWRHTLEPRKVRFGWGTAASPVLYEERLYLVKDNDEDSYLLALDKRTGEQIWRVARDEKSNWSTPYVWSNERGSEIVTLGSGKVRSYDLDGSLLWSLQGMSSITIATPYAHNGLLYFSSGYVGDRLRPVYAVRPGADGDISLSDDETSNDSVAWCQRTAGPYNPSTLIYQDRLYVLLDRALVACYDPGDGSVVFEPERLPRGRAFTSSPWAYGDKVFCLNEDGVTYVLVPGIPSSSCTRIPWRRTTWAWPRPPSQATACCCALPSGSIAFGRAKASVLDETVWPRSRSRRIPKSVGRLAGTAAAASFDGLQRQVPISEFGHVVQLGVVLVIVAFLVGHQIFEQFLRHGIRVGATFACPTVVLLGAIFFHLSSVLEHLFDIVDLLHLGVRNHLDVALEEQNAFGQSLDVQHLLDCCCLKQPGQQIVSLIIAMKMEVHIVVDSRQFVSHCFVQ